MYENLKIDFRIEKDFHLKLRYFEMIFSLLILNNWYSYINILKYHVLPWKI